jgi:hypothetical protein
MAGGKQRKGAESVLHPSQDDLAAKIVQQEEVKETELCYPWNIFHLLS